MKITVECYGVLSELCAPVCALDIEATAPTVASVLDALAARYPACAAHLPLVACARGDELVPRSQAVQAGETLALLPPVSGG